MLNLTYEYKAIPRPEQVQLIEDTLSVCRKVWNFALRERKDWINSRKCQINACSISSEYIITVDPPFPNYAQQCKSLTKAKADFPELSTVNAQALQQVLKKLETAFVDMRRKGMGFPRFKNKYQMRSFVYPQLGKGQILQGNQVKLPQLGWLEYVKSREIPEGFIVKQARIVRKASGYFVILTKDWHLKLAHKLCDRAGMIFAEDIDFRIWAKGMFAKQTLNAGFGQFISILQWVCWKRDVYFAKVNKDYTSQVCPQCDTHTGKKELSNRVHFCPSCGYTTDRDVAAAQIIRNRGLSGVGRILDIKQNACGDGLTGTGNRLVKNPRNRKKGEEASQKSPS